MSAALSMIAAAFMAAFPKAIIAILMRFAGEKFIQAYLEKLIIAGLKAASRLSVNTVDDELAELVESRLKEAPENG